MKELNIKPTDKLVVNLDILQIDYSEEKKQALRHELSKMYKIPLRNVIVNAKTRTIDEEGKEVSLTNDVIKDIQQPEFQVKLFEEYIKLNSIDVDFESIKKIDKYVNSFVDFDAYSKYKSYKFKYVKWDNYLSYGEDNYFSFEDLKGLVLLNGQPENQCGKTTFAIDLLRFALFGKSKKSPTLDSVFNVHRPEATSVMVEVGLEIEGEDYVIRRIITRPPLSKRTSKSKCKQTIEYFKVVDGKNELISNIEGENNIETNNIIRDSIGNVDDYNLVVSATAYSLEELLRMGQTDKSKLFSRWLGLLSIEYKEEIAKKLWKENISKELISSRIKKSDVISTLEYTEKSIKDYTEELNNHKKLISEIDKKLTEKKSERDELLSSKRIIDNDITNTNISQVERDIVAYNEELALKRGVFNKKKEEYMPYKSIEFNEEKYNALVNDKLKEKEECDRLVLEKNNVIVEKRSDLKNIYSMKSKLEQLIEIGKCPTCNLNISTHTHEDILSDYDKDANVIIEEGQALKKEYDELVNKANIIKNELEELYKLKEEYQNKTKLELELIVIKENIETIKKSIELKEAQIKLYNDCVENIKYNNAITEKITCIDGIIRSTENDYTYQQQQITSIETQIKMYEKDVVKYKNELKLIEDEEKIIREWSVYQELVGKNGIVKLVLKRALPVINNEISRILNGLCDFEIKLSINEENKVCIDMYQDDTKMDLGVCSSGFEGTFSALAIRSALASLATISKPNFLVLDEIVQTIGPSNYGNLTELYRRIVNNYQFILHITHNEMLEDIHDGVITVYKEDKISKLRLTKK